jgi:hypothetical protein
MTQKNKQTNHQRPRRNSLEKKMKNVVMVLTTILAFAGTFAHADEATEQEIIKTLMDGNAYAKMNLKAMEDTVAKDGSLEFWSSGGLLNEVDADAAPEEFEAISLNAKHITVITLVPGQVAVAQYYSEGSMSPKTSAAVSNYRTRVTQVFVKEGGKWKVRAAHFSPISGGAGTSRSTVDD